MTLLAEKAYARPFQRSSRQIVAAPRSVSAVNYKGIWGTKSNRALAHALNQFKHGWSVDVAVRLEMERILRASIRDDSAYATINPDGDGGLVAQWRAGRSYLTIEIGEAESAFTYADTNGELIANEVTADRLDAGNIKTALAKFTAELGAVNPHWRKLFS